MLSVRDNELLVRTGPGTPMGALFRRFWSPVMLADELGGPDAAPVPVQILGEQLLAFRDDPETIVLLATSWLDRSAKRYPALERGGIIWAYLGPGEPAPEFPHVEILHTPASHRHIVKILVHCNYLQSLEGDVDLGHTSFLHSRLDNTTTTGMHFLHSTVNKTALFDDKAPEFFVTETNYGVMHGVRRRAEGDKYHWRLGQYLLPTTNLIASQRGGMVLANIRIPIDDARALLFRCFVQPERPLDDADRAVIFGGFMAPEMIPGTPHMKENAGNDYLRDHDRQRAVNFTGIGSIVAQDAAMTEDQGGAILDRSREYLVSSDRVVIGLRKKLLGRVKDLIDGVEPPEATNPSAYAVRGLDVYLPRDVAVEEATKDLIRVGALAR